LSRHRVFHLHEQRADLLGGKYVKENEQAVFNASKTSGERNVARKTVNVQSTLVHRPSGQLIAKEYNVVAARL
jgi:hypothetical protein